MKPLTSEQIDKIVDENGEIYQRNIVKKTFAMRTQGLWGGSLMGFLVGAAVGTIIALSPIGIIGMAGVATIMPEVIGAFALAGMLTGAATMTMVNSSAGAATELAKMDARRTLREDPARGLAEAAKLREADAAQGSSANHSVPFNGGSKKVYSLRKAVIFGGIALAAGALILGLGGAPLLGVMAGAVTHASPAIAAILKIAAVEKIMLLTTCAMFGAVFGIDGPTMAANVTQFMGDLFGGKKKPRIIGGPEKSCAVATAPLSAASVTSEEAALLNERLAAQKTDFSQNVTQQRTATATAIATGV